MSGSSPTRAIVVGAGIAGLTTALALRRVGVHVAVLERAERLCATPAAFALTPSAVEVLWKLGLGDAIAILPAARAGARLRFVHDAVLHTLRISLSAADGMRSTVRSTVVEQEAPPSHSDELDKPDRKPA